MVECGQTGWRRDIGPYALHGTTFLALLLHRLCLAEGGMLEPVVEGFWQGVNGLG